MSSTMPLPVTEPLRSGNRVRDVEVIRVHLALLSEVDVVHLHCNGFIHPLLPPTIITYIPARSSSLASLCT